MPKKLHDKLRKQFKKKGFKVEELDHAVYGTMTEIEKKKKGK